MSQGPQGNQGPIGPGNYGQIGGQGPTGAQGRAGTQGAQGNSGNQGNQGNQGAQGAQGRQGTQGNIGVQGNQGNQGAQGNQGYLGSQGPQGPPSSVQGPQGPQGPTGRTGPTGPASTIQGPQGAQGKTGVQGPAGPLGSQGALSVGNIMNAGSGGRVLTSTGATGVAYGNSKLTFDGLTLTVTGSIYASGDITGLSDERVKTNIVTIPDALEKINKMRGVFYTITDTSERKTGVIAQEVEAVLPEVVITNESGKSVAYGNIVGLLIEGIKVLSHRCDELEKKLESQSTGDVDRH